MTPNQCNVVSIYQSQHLLFCWCSLLLVIFPWTENPNIKTSNPTNGSVRMKAYIKYFRWMILSWFLLYNNNSQSYIAYIQIPLAVFRHEKIAKSKFDFFSKYSVLEITKVLAKVCSKICQKICRIQNTFRF